MGLRLQLGQLFFQLRRPILTDEEKIQLLRDNDSAAIRDILRLAFTPNLTLSLPVGDFTSEEIEPYYGPSFQTYLLGEWMRFKRIFLQPYSEMKAPRLRQAFVELLKSLPVEEAQILLDVQKKNLPYISEEVVRLAFPDLLPPVEVKQTVAPVTTQTKPAKPSKPKPETKAKASKSKTKPAKAEAV